MDSEKEHKKCFTNPNRKSRPIDVDVKEDEEKPCGAPRPTYTCPKTSSEKKVCEPKPKRPICPEESDEESSFKSSPSKDSRMKAFKNNLAKQCDKEQPTVHQECPTVKTKTFIEAHCETMATLKYAMNDFVCKIFGGTSEAVSMLQEKCAKQKDCLKRHSKTNTRDDSCENDPESSTKPKPKKCSDNESEEILQRLLHKVSNNPSDDGSDYTTSLLNQVRTTVASVVILLKDMDITKLLPNLEQSSKFDVPDPNLPKKPKKVSMTNMKDHDIVSSNNLYANNITSQITEHFPEQVTAADSEYTNIMNATEFSENLEQENDTEEEDTCQFEE
ncbi:uncharacterized protein LOC142984000 [Anticarsia gemmatalis]|uniref:uncharacterized protein LOC142984000 n=1 Tax=Anticarsia gemmatalis TaxID=129554 RepID=UPI003F76471F